MACARSKTGYRIAPAACLYHPSSVVRPIEVPMPSSPHVAAQRPSTDFWKFWAGQTISNLGSSFTNFALPLLIFRLTGSALNLAIASASTFLPYLLFGLPIGAWVDRVDRKRLMIVTDLLRALLLASIPLLAALGQ